MSAYTQQHAGLVYCTIITSGSHTRGRATGLCTCAFKYLYPHARSQRSVSIWLSSGRGARISTCQLLPDTETKCIPSAKKMSKLDQILILDPPVDLRFKGRWMIISLTRENVQWVSGGELPDWNDFTLPQANFVASELASIHRHFKLARDRTGRYIPALEWRG